MINKRQILAAVAAACLAAPGLALASGDGTGIAGSPHDFSDGYSDELGGTADESWNDRGEICRVCHIPHDNENAAQLYANGLLWNHDVATTSYTLYSSATLDGAIGQPGGTSKLCLGCHDGTVALNAFDHNSGGAKFPGGKTMKDIYGGGIAGFVMPNQAVGDLSGTHPISIVYDTADPNLRAKSYVIDGGTTTIDDVLDGGKVQCSSCHDVHNQESVGGTHLLRVAQTVAQGGSASGLCLTCHIK